MPIIINGGSRSAGGWWAKHLENGEKNERVRVVGFTGLTAETIPEAFREMYAISLGTKCTNYFYQANINPREDERLTDKQLDEAVDRLERNLGLTGQPRFVVDHEKKGRVHRHVVWSRIDTERMTAISDSLTAAIHERTSRELEITFDLERGRSILVRDRDFERPERRPRKHETFRALDSGIDPQTVKAEIAPLWRRADNGQSFKAALEASGDYVLARGDRRDFVIIDRAGDDHSLARRLGVKVAEVRARMADIDAASLPSVEEARARQHARAAEIDPARGQVPEPAAPVFDRDAAEAAWTEQLTDAAIAHDETARATPKPERAGDAPDHAERGIPAYPAPSENAPEVTATRPIVADGPETAGTGIPSPAHDPDPHAATRAAEKLADRTVGLLGKAFAALSDLFEGLFSTPKVPTPDERHRSAVAAEEAERLASFRSYVAEQSRQSFTVNQQISRDQQQHERDEHDQAAARRSREAGDPRRHEDGRERER